MQKFFREAEIMGQDINIPVEKLMQMTVPAAVFLATVIVGWIIRKIIVLRLHRWSQKTATKLDDIFISAIETPMLIWFVILGLYIGSGVSKLPENIVDIVHKILLVLIIFSVTVVLANIVSSLIKVYSAKVETALPVTSLTRHIGRVTIYVIGILIILNSLGISITPILAALGVGGLAVALALQDTLSNLFAGFYITIARQVRAGDYIKLDTGEEGYVTDITWRTTTIRMLPNNLVLVPNEKLIKSIIVNYYMPDKELAVLVNLGVHYNSDLKKVERVTCEVGKEIMKEVQGGVPEFEPFIRYNTFADSSINFTVILRAKEFVDQYLIKHEFVKRLHERYAKEGIVIPFPIRAINYEQEAKK
jgi:small-conductance mechanosensitive channel